MNLIPSARWVLAVSLLLPLAAAEPKPDQEPPVIDPGPVGSPPSDAIRLFDGKDLSHFRGERGGEPGWKVLDGTIEVTPTGGMFSKEEFGDCQLHVEWASPAVSKGDGQGRGDRKSVV